MACGGRFAYIDILANKKTGKTRNQIKPATVFGLADIPAFSIQLFIKGELVGGCDIITEMYQSGELQGMVKDAVET